MTHKRLIPDSGRSVEVVLGGGEGARKPKLSSSSASSLRHNKGAPPSLSGQDSWDYFSHERTFCNRSALPGAQTLEPWVRSSHAGHPAAPAGWSGLCLTPPPPGCLHPPPAPLQLTCSVCKIQSHHFDLHDMSSRTQKSCWLLLSDYGRVTANCFSTMRPFSLQTRPKGNSSRTGRT